MSAGLAPLLLHSHHALLSRSPREQTNTRASANGRNCSFLMQLVLPVPSQWPQLSQPFSLYRLSGLAGMSAGLAPLLPCPQILQSQRTDKHQCLSKRTERLAQYALQLPARHIAGAKPAAPAFPAHINTVGVGCQLALHHSCSIAAMPYDFAVPENE